MFLTYLESIKTKKIGRVSYSRNVGVMATDLCHAIVAEHVLAMESFCP